MNLRVLAILALAATAWGGDVTRYHVRWDTPSENSSGSMPLGNGDIGLNVWVEADGDLLFYLSKTDAWSETARLQKLGRVRVKLTPNPFRRGRPFLQELQLDRGRIEIRAGGETLLVWVDAHHPVAHVEIASRDGVAAEARVEIWRTQPRTLPKEELHSAYGMDGGPEPVVVDPDTIVENARDAVVWYHRNERSIWPLTLRHQGLESLMPKLSDPLLGRTFGARLEGLPKADATTLRAAEPRKQILLSVFPLTAQAPADDWNQMAAALARRVSGQPIGARRAAHERWWRDFWRRSWIEVSGPPEAEVVSRGYALQRFLHACAGRGAFPIKFNGSIFTVDGREKDHVFDADYRRWGGPYWFQNTRLPYWSMFAAGDFDLMRPFFRMYRDALPLALGRTPLYFGHGGAFFPETMYFWGAYANSNYGWDRAGKHPSYVDNRYIRWYWQGAIEYLAMALDYLEHTRDDSFARQTLRPMADAIFEFYAQHYPRENGKLVIRPAQALETFWDVEDPTPEIAGLRFVLDGLKHWPSVWKPEWRALREALPEVPRTQEGGQTRIAVARVVRDKPSNLENPELYAVFPYRLFGVGKPELEVARNTFHARRMKRTGGWMQDAIQAAALGLTAEARRDVVANFSEKDPGSRFPAFWGPNYDWVPDQDHGSVSMIALQRMLLQSAGDKIHLLPAWPKEWSVSFRLHAPGPAVVEGEYRNGVMARLEVTPPARRKDLVISE